MESQASLQSVQVAKPNAEAPLEGEALFSALRAQLDYYFSPPNLANDAYLVSQMNQDRQVDINIVASFPKVQILTTDRELLLKALKACTHCSPNEDGTMIRATSTLERKTLILREIPATVPVEEVKSIFSFPGCASIVDIHSDIGDTWFVTFSSEAECTDTVLALSGRSFQGKPVRARVKNETLCRSFYFRPAAPVFQPQSAYVGVPEFIPYQLPIDTQARRGRKPGVDSRFPAGIAPGVAPADRQSGRGGKKTGKAKNRKGSVASVAGSGRMSGVEPQLEDPEQFPALPTSSRKSASCGYTREFQQYSREDMAEIINAVNKQGFVQPTALSHHALARSAPIAASKLLEPFPIMYPNSPSPVMQPLPRNSANMPELDLGKASAPWVAVDGSPSIKPLPKPDPVVESKIEKEVAPLVAEVVKPQATAEAAAPVKSQKATAAAAKVSYAHAIKQASAKA